MYNKKTDDELDVFALQRDKMRENAKDTSDLLKKVRDQRDRIAKIRQANDQMRQQLSALGVEVEEPKRIREAPKRAQSVIREKIQIPENMDYRKEYQKLVEEAHSRGFVDTRPEQLLTREEMERAMARSQRLDRELAQMCALDMTDIGVVVIGVALHILRNVLRSNAAEAAKHMTEEPVRNAKIKDALNKSTDILRIAPFKRVISIKSPDEILANTPSFQNVSDCRFTRKEDYLGYHSIWGWIVGVFNIITDTITVRDFHTFQPEPSEESSVFLLSQQYLPFRDLFIPFVDHGMYGLEENLIAAVIREAYILIPHQLQYGQVNELFERNKKLFEIFNSAAQDIGGVFSWDALNDALMSAGWSNLINTLLIAIHGLFCPSDCSQKQYLARTMKVVTVANWIGTTMCSVADIAAERWDLVDYAGMLTGALNITSLTKLLIEVKSEFLISEYLPGLQEQLRSYDQYFA